ncbi:polyisoprenoid-binding protein [Acinetobacter baumannii MDR_MMC4]|nr:polyisoprenoid-binding protein [Acinetobacter baumannii MDR_MMC4]
MHLKTLSFGLAVALASTVTLAAPVDYKIDPTHTATVFSWNHFGFSTPSANFSDIQGVIKVDNAKPANSSVNVTIPLSSVNTNVPALDKEFQEEAWFNAAKYPNITFKSTKVETKDKKHFKITGDLTVKGITKPVVLDAVLNKQGEHPMAKVPAIGFNATTSFNRSDFGLGNYVPNVGDKITVNITTEATAASAAKKISCKFSKKSPQLEDFFN